MTDVVLELEHLRKAYYDTVAVDDVSLAVARGEVVCLLGPSGCGKTTTLRMIAGIVDPTSGRVAIAGNDITHLPPHRRDTGMVFQNYALFPHMTVAQNVAFAPQNVGMERTAIRRRVDELLELVQMSRYRDRLPNALSGGQQQRVALARALAVSPAVLLLDEPFSNLDAQLRVQLRDEVRSLVERLHMTTVFVTHDQDEALAIADRIVIMNQGRVEQIGTPRDIYEFPQTLFVAQFVGRCNVLPVSVLSGGRAVELPGGQRLEVGSLDSGATNLVVRPHHVVPARGQDANTLTGTISRVVYQGPETHLTLDCEAFTLLMDAPSGSIADRTIGDRVSVFIEPKYAQVLS